jgi:hypothetical protein
MKLLSNSNVDWRDIAISLRTENPMTPCEKRDELQERLRAAFEAWYGLGSRMFRVRSVRPVPPKRRFTTFSGRCATTYEARM